MLKRMSDLIFITLISTLLFACGGGGGGGAPVVDDGGGNNPPGAVNTAPVANAGENQIMRFGSGSISLDGSVSNDADGDTFTFLWEFLVVPTGSSSRNFILCGITGISISLFCSIPCLVINRYYYWKLLRC